jgi:hypothetical protein
MRCASKAPRTQSHASSVRWLYTRASGASARSVAHSVLAVTTAPETFARRQGRVCAGRVCSGGRELT